MNFSANLKIQETTIPMKVNRSQLADIFGAAKTTVDVWHKDICPVESGGGKSVPLVFDTAAVFQW